MRRRVVMAVAFLVAVSGLLAASGPARGATPSGTTMPSSMAGDESLCTAKAKARVVTLTGRAVSLRQDLLRQLDGSATRASALTAKHRAQIGAITDRALEGLAALKPAVRSADGCSVAISLAKGIVTDFRVYGLVAPQIRLAVAGDTGAHAAAQLTDVLPALKAAVAAMPDTDTKTQAQSLLSNYSGSATAAAEAFGPVADAVLALSADDYPGNRATLEAQMIAVARGVQALRVAATDADTLADLLTA
ncbi:hypothetical protein ACIB24_11305 [Spongisporangium articulatum]|uniref:Uncharacterized protein n=1 Tax=Spongisporangium articulatum TaxID=3362603 RepID=A0ABW8AMP8_9ACTN